MRYNSRTDFYQKIANVNYCTDYSGMDSMYPPIFVWKEDKENKVLNLLQQKRINLYQDFIFNLYIHFPYCEQKCLFCRQYSCVPKNKSEFNKYLISLFKEIRLYSNLFKKPKIGNIYFGSGTPTLFDLKRIIEAIKKNFIIISGYQFNVESTFNCLNYQKLKTLKNIGVNRLVLGVQSFDKKVIKIINREQNKRKFCDIFKKARQIRIRTINVELICGLPKQTLNSFIKDLQYIINLSPDSIHIYSYLQTSLTILGKRGYPDRNSNLKREMKEKGIILLEKNGYHFYGDDFAKKSIHRNASFSEDNPSNFGGVIAFGQSSVSRLSMIDGTSLKYINVFDLDKYENCLKNDKLPVKKYYLLDKKEKIRAHVIQSIKYRGLDLNNFSKKFKIDFLKEFSKELKILQDLNKVKIKNRKIRINEWVVFSKAFYSEKILTRCKKIISEKYLHLKKYS